MRELVFALTVEQKSLPPMFSKMYLLPFTSLLRLTSHPRYISHPPFTRPPITNLRRFIMRHLPMCLRLRHLLPTGIKSLPPGVPGEGLIGVIPNASRKKSLISMESFNIIVTNQRMVFATITSQMIKDAAASHRGEGVGGFFAAMGSGYTLWERYLKLPPEQALRENPNNFAVYLNQIRKVKYSGRILFSKGAVSVGLKVGGGYNNNNNNDNAKLEIDTIGGRYNFEIAVQFQQQTAQVLKKAGLIK